MVEVNVYLDNGLIYKYEVYDKYKAREHASAIVATGYRHCEHGCFEHFPPRRILKVKCIGEFGTIYPDKKSST